MPTAPKIQWNAMERYTFYESDGNPLSFQVSAKHSDKVYQDAVNFELARSDSYTLVDARISLYSEAGDWELSLWGKNLTEDSYFQWSLLVDTFAIMQDIYNDPRTFGVSFYKRFGG